MPSHTNLYVLDPFWSKGVVQDSFVVSIRLSFGGNGCKRPIVHFRIDPLHWEVRTFYDPDLDRSTTVNDPQRSPLLQVNHDS